MAAPDRVELIRQSSSLTGIDFVQVSPNQLELLVFIHHLTVPAALAASLATIATEQVEIRAVGQTAPASVAVKQVLAMAAISGRHALRLAVEAPGGFGYYRLRINHPAIDSYFNDILFSFKADCPTELDCKADPHECPPEPPVDFPVDYRACDFWSFRQGLLDFAAQRYPDWEDRLEADIGMMVVELLSALGDEFSYASDRIAREHLLDEASQRRSLRHLAALVDYPLDNGSGAFTWLDVQASAAGVLAGGTGVTDARGQVVFEVGRGLRDAGNPFAVSNLRNDFKPYLWDENDVCLFAGSRELTLQGHHAGAFVPDPAIDPAGKWVLLKTVPTDPERPERRLAVRVTRATQSHDPLNGNPVTEIEWDTPTPFELDLETLVVRGNLLPATSGETRTRSFRIGPPPPGAPPMDRALERVGANHDLTDRPDETPDEADETDDIAVIAPTRRAKFLYSLTGSETTPLVWLRDAESGMRPEVRLRLQGGNEWAWMLKLIGDEVASATDEVFTLEDGTYRTVFAAERIGGRFAFDDYGSALGQTIRLGDGEFGRAPADGTVFDVAFRLGNGRLMNVAADTLTSFTAGAPPFVTSITNPLAAEGGRDPETVESIRTNAPQAFRYRPLRAVRPEDYEDIAERLPWVQRAGAALRWTGSWAAMFVTPDPRDEFGLSRAHRLELELTMDRVRQAGRDLRVLDPRYANIDLEIRVCVAPDAYPGEVKDRVLAALFGRRGTTGFFDPDNFTFGTPLSRAALMATIQDVAGVRAVEGMRVRRRGRFDWRAFEELALPVGTNELVRVTNDRLLPERGAVRLIMEGGA
jgi:hypothetical protein